MSHTILLTGCHQSQGQSLARLLAHLPDTQLWLTGDDADGCAQLCSTIRAETPGCNIHPLDCEDSSPLGMIRSSGASLVVHADGPFAQYAYDMAHACLQAGVAYVDIADRRSFIASFTGHLHQAAERAQIPMITGASLTPALSSALAEELASQFEHLQQMRITIIPGVRSLQPGSQLSSLLGTIGRPMSMLKNGHRVQAVSGRSRRPLFTPALGRCTSVLCDTPDNETLLPLLPALQSLETRMALPGRLTPLAVYLLSYLRQQHRGEQDIIQCPPARYHVAAPKGRAARKPGSAQARTKAPATQIIKAALTPSSRKKERLLPWLLRRLAHGPNHHGGIIVEAHGMDHLGHTLTRTSSVIATPAEAPFLPLLPAVAMVRQILQAPQSVPVGARLCAGILPLKDIMAETAIMQTVLSREAQRAALLVVGSEASKRTEASAPASPHSSPAPI